VSQNFSLHERYRDDERTEAGSDRSFGCTVGAILMALGAIKAFAAGAVTPFSLLIFLSGAVLLLLGLAVPLCLAPVKRLWLKIGAGIAMVVNPVILALLFFIVVTPMALVMRITGKRPLRLVPDRTSASYWIARQPLEGGASSMRRQY
jgi:hypothetical protein